MGFGYRSEEARRELRAEAERLVRAGAARAEVAARLGVPGSTLAQWAQAGGWRRKDLDQETAAAIAAGLNPALAGRRNTAPLNLTDVADGKAMRTQAEQLSAIAVALTEQGEMRSAETALRLAERMLRVGDRLQGGGKAMAPPQHEDDGINWLDELRRRLETLLGYVWPIGSQDPGPSGPRWTTRHINVWWFERDEMPPPTDWTEEAIDEQKLARAERREPRLAYGSYAEYFDWLGGKTAKPSWLPAGIDPAAGSSA
ncbi:hypothetical protein GC169_12275 [bacterium]|nr:hypothetical protein [bacterium]